MGCSAQNLSLKPRYPCLWTSLHKPNPPPHHKTIFHNILCSKLLLLTYHQNTLGLCSFHFLSYKFLDLHDPHLISILIIFPFSIIQQKTEQLMTQNGPFESSIYQTEVVMLIIRWSHTTLLFIASSSGRQHTKYCVINYYILLLNYY